MAETQLLADLVWSCRPLDLNRHNPDVLYMPHDLEQDLIQGAKDIESKRHADRERPRQDGETLRGAKTLRFS
jgi:hypothetical protein